MDSLMSNTEDMSPRKYMSKVLPLPHLNTVVCGTGDISLILNWHNYIQAHCTASDINALNRVAKSKLPELLDAYGFNVPATATLYQFGLDPRRKEFKGFAYRSEHQFRSERLKEGWGIKPYGDQIIAEINAGSIPMNGQLSNSIAAIISRQREIDQQPGNERPVGIGGEVHILEATINYQAMWTCHRFDDYEELLGQT